MLSRSLYATRIRSTSPISDCICKFAEGRPVCVCPDLCVQVDGHALQLGVTLRSDERKPLPSLAAVSHRRSDDCSHVSCCCRCTMWALIHSGG